MNVFKFDGFIRMLRGEFHDVLHDVYIQDLEDYWRRGLFDKASSVASKICRRIPDRYMTDEVRNGIEAIFERSSTYVHSPHKPLTEKTVSSYNARRTNKPLVGERGTKDTELDLATVQYYLSVLARGIRELNMRDFNTVMDCDQTSKSAKYLHEIAYNTKDIFKRLETRNTTIVLCIEWYEDTLKDLLAMKYNQVDDIPFITREAVFRTNEFAIFESTYILLKRLTRRLRKYQDGRQTQETKNKEQDYNSLHWYISAQNYKTRHDGLLTETQSLKEQLRMKTEYCGNLVNENLKHCETTHQLKQDYDTLAVKHMLCDREVCALRKEKYALQQRAGFQTEIECVDKRHFDLKDRITALKNQVDVKIVQLNKATKHSESRERKNDIFCQQLEDEQSRVRRLEEEKTELEESLKRKTYENQRQLQRVRELENENNNLKTREGGERRRKQDYDSKVTQLEEEKSKLQDRLKRIEAERSNQEKEVNKIKLENKALTEKLELLKDQHKRHNETAKQIEKKKTSVETSFLGITEGTVQKLEEDNLNLREENTNLNMKLRDANRHIEQYDQLVEISNSLEKENKRLQDSQKQLELELERTRLTLRKAEEDNKHLQNGIGNASEITRKFRESSALVNNLQREKRDEEERNQQIQRQLEQQQGELQKIRSEHRQIQERNEAFETRMSHASENTKKLEESSALVINLQRDKRDGEERNVQLQKQIEQQQRELQRLKSELRQTQEKNDDLQNRMSNATENKKKLEESPALVLNLQRDKRDGEERNQKMKRQLEQQQADLLKIKSEHRQTQEQNEDLQKRNVQLQKQIEQQQRELQRIKYELRQTQEKNEDLQNRLKDEQRQIEQYDQAGVRLKSLEKENKRLQDSQNQLEGNLDHYCQELERTRSKLRKADEENKHLQNGNQQMKRQLEQQQADLLKIKSEPRQTQEKDKDLQKRNVQLQKQIEQQQRELQRIKLELRQTQEKNEDLQNRFSKVAAAQLTHDNPNIADLSDKNRPTKLAEQFSELYDNEWTEAFSAIEDDQTNSATEKDIVKQFRDILLNCFAQCTNISTKQIAGIKGMLLSPSTGASTTLAKQLTSEHAKLITDLRKQTTGLAMEGIKQEMTKTYPTSTTYREMKLYIEKCTELCWYMVIQSPPVFIDDRHNSGDRFDKDIFKAYTKSGTIIDFVVWPPVYLHKGGPLLCKGVAQGRQ